MERNSLWGEKLWPSWETMLAKKIKEVCREKGIEPFKPLRVSQPEKQYEPRRNGNCSHGTLKNFPE
jgi:hypothetical protein